MKKQGAKDNSKKERPKKYEEKLAVKGSFMDIMKAATKHAEKHSEKKKS